jgi:hypothetical protein
MTRIKVSPLLRGAGFLMTKRQLYLFFGTYFLFSQDDRKNNSRRIAMKNRYDHRMDLLKFK